MSTISIFATGRRRAVAAILAAAVGAGLFLVGSATASPPPGSTTDVTFVPIAAHRVLSNAYLAAGHTTSPVLIGGSTTVPTNATTVQLLVAVKGTGNGSVFFYPAGNTAPGQFFNWVKGGGQTTVATNIGTANEVTFQNQSSAAINLTVTITGYSTQVSEGDITGSGGSAGQVLTNTGTGAAWGPGGTVYVHRYPNTGLPTAFNAQPVGQLNLPAGTYLVQVTGWFHGYSSTAADCHLVYYGFIEDTAGATWSGNEARSGMALQAVVTVSSSDPVVLDCRAVGTPTYLEDAVLTAVPMGTVHDQS